MTQTKSDQIVKLLSASATASSDVFERSPFSQHSFQFDGVTAAACTVKIMVSLTNVIFYQLGADVTADGMVILPTAILPYIRVDRTGGAGAITVTLCSGCPQIR